MTRVEDRLSELLHQAAAPSARGVSFEEVARRVRRRRVVRAAASAGAVAVVVAVTVIAAGIVTFGPGSRVAGSGPASAHRAQAGPGGPANPVACNANLYPLACPGSVMAEKTTVAGAQAKAGFPVPVPGTAAASRANLTQAWVTTHSPIWADGRPGREVALVFDNGKVDILMHPVTRQSALSYFHAFVAQKKENGAAAAWIGRVNGRPALVTIGHSNGEGVNFWRNGILINIYSNTKAYGIHTLLAIADSMH